MDDRAQPEAESEPPRGHVGVLMLEGSPQDAELIREHLNLGESEVRVDVVSDRAAFETALRSVRYNLILADYSLPSFDGITALEIAREHDPDLPFILVSGVPGEEVAIDAMNRGATDYVLKQRLGRLPGAVTRALTEACERAERRRAEEHLKLLVGELSHRVKNTLATVVSIARQTVRRSASLEDFEPAFLGRVQVLAEAHDLLFQGDWTGAEIGEVVRRTLKPFGDREHALTVEGPSVRLTPRRAVTLSLVLHELATNAAKYGALSVEPGQVRIDWKRMQGTGERLELVWAEKDGPRVEPPAEKGFGSSLIERGVAYELDGEADIRYEPDGLVCVLTFPLD